MKIRILRTALDDLAGAREFYERQQEGLGEYFLDSLIAEIDSLAFYGGIHPIREGFHRVLNRRFPFAVYYRQMENEVIVFRVLDCRRDPRWMRAQLRIKD